MISNEHFPKINGEYIQEYEKSGVRSNVFMKKKMAEEEGGEDDVEATIKYEDERWVVETLEEEDKKIRFVAGVDAQLPTPEQEEMWNGQVGGDNAEKTITLRRQPLWLFQSKDGEWTIGTSTARDPPEDEPPEWSVYFKAESEYKLPYEMAQCCKPHYLCDTVALVEHIIKVAGGGKPPGLLGLREVAKALTWDAKELGIDPKDWEEKDEDSQAKEKNAFIDNLDLELLTEKCADKLKIKEPLGKADKVKKAFRPWKLAELVPTGNAWGTYPTTREESASDDKPTWRPSKYMSKISCKWINEQNGGDIFVAAHLRTRTERDQLEKEIQAFDALSPIIVSHDDGEPVTATADDADESRHMQLTDVEHKIEQLQVAIQKHDDKWQELDFQVMRTMSFVEYKAFCDICKISFSQSEILAEKIFTVSSRRPATLATRYL